MCIITVESKCILICLTTVFFSFKYSTPGQNGANNSVTSPNFPYFQILRTFFSKVPNKLVKSQDTGEVSNFEQQTWQPFLWSIFLVFANFFRLTAVKCTSYSCLVLLKWLFSCTETILNVLEISVTFSWNTWLRSTIHLHVCGALPSRQSWVKEILVLAIVIISRVAEEPTKHNAGFILWIPLTTPTI